MNISVDLVPRKYHLANTNSLRAFKFETQLILVKRYQIAVLLKPSLEAWGKSRYCMLLVSEDKKASPVFWSIFKAALPIPKPFTSNQMVFSRYTYILSSNDSIKFANWVTKDSIGQKSNKKLIDSPKEVSYNPSRFVEK